MTIHNSAASVSVVLPCYRCADFLRRAVNSVISQTLLPTELILIDDCSDDDNLTLSIIESLVAELNDAKYVQVKMLSLGKNMGASFARNIGWDNSSGDYVAFLDADDAWHPRKLEIQYDFMITNQNIDLCAHGSSLHNPGESDLEISTKDIRCSPIRPYSMLFKNKISTRTVMLKKNCQVRFDTSMRYAEDYDLWLRMIGLGCQAAYLNINLAYIYRPEWSSGGLSGNLWAMQAGESKALFNIYKRKKISLLVLIGIEIFSWIKFLRRVFIKSIKRVIGNG